MIAHPKTLKILQYNVQHSMTVTKPLLERRGTQEFDIIMIQEPWINTQIATSVAGGKGFTLVHPPSHWHWPRVNAYVSKRIDPSGWNTTFYGRDLLTITLKTGEGKINIHNIYNPGQGSRDEQIHGTLPTLQQALQSEGEHIVVGDFNLHHPQWNNNLRRAPQPEALYLAGLMEGLQLTQVVPPGSTTWHRGASETTIDLAWLEPTLLNRLIKCVVRGDLDCQSDHLPVATILHEAAVLAKPKERRNWKGIDEAGIIERTKQLLNTSQPIEEIRDTEGIDREATRLTRTLQDVIQEFVPIKRPSRWSTAAWTVKCGEAVTKAKRLRREVRQCPSEANIKRYNEAVRAKGRLVTKEKRKQFRREVAEAAARDDIWNLAKWARTKAQDTPELPQIPALRDGEGWARERNEKERVLFQRFFPPPPEVDLTDIPEATYPDQIHQTEEITEEEISWIIQRVGANKAPGPDDIPNRLLKITSEAIAPCIARIARGSIRQGYHAKEFKRAVTVILKKPHKDYTEAGSYRPIALLNTIGKIVETTVANRIRRILEENKLLPPTQMGARQGRGTMTALELLTEQVHAAWSSKTPRVVTILSLDISGAFDNVSHARLIHNMRQHRLPEQLTQFTQSFLSHRTTRLRFEGQDSDERQIQTGIPQGSVLSPILFLIFAAELLKIGDNPAKRLSSIGFVDDTQFITHGTSTEQNCRVLEGVQIECEAWAKKHGVKFNPAKYEMLHLTRRGKKFNLNAKIKIGERELASAASQSIRILGMQIDSKLNWAQHIKEVQKKMSSQMFAMTRLVASTWGAPFARARLIYKQVIQPAMDYGGPLWHRPRRGGKEAGQQTKKLDILQNKCLRLITGAFKATPIEVLEREANVYPRQDMLDAKLARHIERTIHTDEQEIVRTAVARIKRTIRPRRGRPPKTKLSPRETKEQWWEKEKKKVEGEEADISYENSTWIKTMVEKEWVERWRKYKERERNHTHPADEGSQKNNMILVHRGLSKAESTIITQIRTGRIGLRGYLHTRKVPGFETGACQCGQEYQDARHMLQCSLVTEGREAMTRQTGTEDLTALTTKPRNAKLLARWWIRTIPLDQFTLAREDIMDEVNEHDNETAD
jgi:exonuclease III